MKIARIGLDQGLRYAVVDGEGDELILLADNPLFDEGKPAGQRLRSEDIRLVFPAIPRSEVVGFGGSYPDGESPASTGDLPVLLKPNASVVGLDDPIVLPPHLPEVMHGVGLAVVIGCVAKDVPSERVHEAILGHTVADDVIGVRTNSAVARGTDTLCPVSPYIETELGPSDLVLASRIDDELSREGHASQLTFPIPELVSHTSEMFTLLPGDIVLTGSSGVHSIDPQIASGQTVEVECEGIGRLRNFVVRR